MITASSNTQHMFLPRKAVNVRKLILWSVRSQVQNWLLIRSNVCLSFVSCVRLFLTRRTFGSRTRFVRFGEPQGWFGELVLVLNQTNLSFRTRFGRFGELGSGFASHVLGTLKIGPNLWLFCQGGRQIIEKLNLNGGRNHPSQNYIFWDFIKTTLERKGRMVTSVRFQVKLFTFPSKTTAESEKTPLFDFEISSRRRPSLLQHCVSAGEAVLLISLSSFSYSCALGSSSMIWIKAGMTSACKRIDFVEISTAVS